MYGQEDTIPVDGPIRTVFLCHGDEHPSCYEQWTVWKRRPGDPPLTRERMQRQVLNDLDLVLDGER